MTMLACSQVQCTFECLKMTFSRTLGWSLSERNQIIVGTLYRNL
jgi:hypothetical protein